MQVNKGKETLTKLKRMPYMEKAFNVLSEEGIELLAMENIAIKCDIGVATLYRWFENKPNMMIEIAALKWMQFGEVVERLYQTRGGNLMSGREEIEFCLDCYIELFINHQRLLKFNSNFDTYIIHKKISENRLNSYIESITPFTNRFHNAFVKACDEGIIKEGITEQDAFYQIMYTMLSLGSRFSYGVLYPENMELDYLKFLNIQKEMFLNLFLKEEK